MKLKHLLSGALVLTIVGCDPFGFGPDFGRPRFETERRPPADSSGLAPSLPAAEIPDTTVWFSAVRFPAGYDWQRDTAYGATEFEITLYKDFTPVLTVASGREGVRPDPDFHHIIDGHLYMRRSSSTGTMISRDGEMVVRIAGKELVCGIFVKDGSIFTLSEPATGGIVLRKDGEKVFVRDDGHAFGGLCEPSYRPNGALYEDEGKLCFCFYVKGSAGYDLFYVQDGECSPAGTKSVVSDMKVVGGRPVTADGYYGTSSISEGRVWRTGTGYLISGKMFSYSDGRHFCGIYDAVTGGTFMAGPGEAVAYCSEKGRYSVAEDDDGISIYRDGVRVHTGAKGYFFSGGCADLRGGRFVAAVTPRDASKQPFVWTGGAAVELDVRGYVSCVEVELSPPRK